MFRAEDYVKVDSLAEAYELCQKRSSLVVGGNVWLKMTGVTKRTIVDLSGLGLDKIEETGDEFRIGCMCTLRQLEVHQGLNQYFGGIFKECTRHIVGVQMRNCATVGGSIFARFGFSDILTCMMALDTYVELYHGGIVPLAEFAKRPVRRDDRDILVRIIIKKDGRKAAYATQRNTETDFPVIACCVSRGGNVWYVSVGARPSRNQYQGKQRIPPPAGFGLYPPSDGTSHRKECEQRMNIQFRLNGKNVQADVEPDVILLDLLRKLGCYSVKRGCETANCGLCTVWLDGKTVLSCSTLAVRVDGRHVTTLEGLQKEAEEFGMFLAAEGGEQCGFCSPGFIMNVLAMERELDHPDEEDIKEYLAGNLCRCSGYMSQLRAVKKYLERKDAADTEGGAR